MKEQRTIIHDEVLVEREPAFAIDQNWRAECDISAPRPHATLVPGCLFVTVIGRSPDIAYAIDFYVGVANATVLLANAAHTMQMAGDSRSG